MIDVVYKHYAVVCISIFMLRITLRLVGLNICMTSFFNYKMGSKRGI